MTSSFSFQILQRLSAVCSTLQINYQLHTKFFHFFPPSSSWQLVVLLCSHFESAYILLVISPLKEFCLQFLAAQRVFQSIPLLLAASPEISSNPLWIDQSNGNTLEDFSWRGQVCSGALWSSKAITTHFQEKLWPGGSKVHYHTAEKRQSGWFKKKNNINPQNILFFFFTVL